MSNRHYWGMIMSNSSRAYVWDRTEHECFMGKDCLYYSEIDSFKCNLEYPTEIRYRLLSEKSIEEQDIELKEKWLEIKKSKNNYLKN